MKKWEELPQKMQTAEVRRYYNILQNKRSSLVCKRAFDVVVAVIMLIVLSPVFLVLAIAIKVDSSGPIFYRQERVTQYGKHFKIHKFRTMVNGADKKGSLVTVKGDSRITRVGDFLRKSRLDEIPQLIDILQGTMTFVGTRPEVPKYVQQYTPAMMATLLLPAGVTSLASIYYKDEAELLDGAEDTDKVYVEQVLPGKMRYNLRSLERFSFWGEICTMLMTALAVAGREFKEETKDEENSICRINTSKQEDSGI